jgi:hypothetical protein
LIGVAVMRRIFMPNVQNAGSGSAAETTLKPEWQG